MKEEKQTFLLVLYAAMAILYVLGLVIGRVATNLETIMTFTLLQGVIELIFLGTVAAFMMNLKEEG